QTASGGALPGLAARQTTIRAGTQKLARAMEKDALPVTTLVKALDELAAGLMAAAVKLLEDGRDTTDSARAGVLRDQSLPVQAKIVAELQALLDRLQRTQQARDTLRRLEKKDQPAHQAITKTLTRMVKDLDRLAKDETELAGKFERLPAKPAEHFKEDAAK